MREFLLELIICFLVGVASLAVVAWDIVSGRIVYLDGIALAIIVLTVGAFFMFNLVWSYRSGELRQVLQDWRTSRGRRDETSQRAA